MKRVISVLAFLLFMCMLTPCIAAPQRSAVAPMVNTIRVEGVIDPALALYVHRSIQVAEQDGAQALVILLETPGGLDTSMRSIVQDFYSSKVPIVVYVWPEGARAASAGAIIMLASNIAAMSPGTVVGAAHPVLSGGGQPGPIMAKKIENDAAAYARSIAARRGRNVEWAEQVVRKSVSATESEALKLHVIDLIAVSQDDLLKKIDGRTVKTAAGEVTIRSANARTEPILPTLRERFIHGIDNPTIAYIFMLLAVYGLIFELSNPGAILPGVVGGISLILALFSLSVLPVNLTGILLIIFSIALFMIDLFVPSHGVLTVGGIIAFTAGSLMLFQSQSPEFRLSLGLVLTMAVLTGGFFLYAVGAGIRAQRNRVVTGAHGMLGRVVAAKTDINPSGKVFTEGSWWTAVAKDEPIMQGECGRIIGMEGLTLILAKEKECPLPESTAASK